MSDSFNYWGKEHFDVKVVSGSEKACMIVFKDDISKYPTMLYGTRIISKKFDVPGSECTIVICKFKTKEICRKHCEFPPTYIREGKVL
jgi:hypothetical protein